VRSPLLVAVLAIALVAVVLGVLVDPGAGILLAFLALLPIADRVFAVTGFLSDDAELAFTRLVRTRQWGRVRARLRRRREQSLALLSPDAEARAARRSVGRRTIPIASIVGTVEAQRARDFDAAFRPPRWARGRWKLMWIARRRGTEMPPISVYRVGERHYVRDGHHRVSVALAQDATTIDAVVVELRPVS